MKRVMRFLAHIFTGSSSGDNQAAVKMFYFINRVTTVFKNRTLSNNAGWPVTYGEYLIGDASGQIAVCTLTTDYLIEELVCADQIAIAGKIYTPNLGIEQMIRNIVSNNNIRFLLLCGKDSSVFHTGQAIQSLFAYGVDREKRIINAKGHFPVLKNLTDNEIQSFLRQITLIDCCGETNSTVLKQKIQSLHQMGSTATEFNPLRNWQYKNESYRLSGKQKSEARFNEAQFTEIKPGGRRVPLEYDRKGFFVITVDERNRLIIVKQYYKDSRAGYKIRGRNAEFILHAIIEKELITQLNHAGYLGAELAKAEAALRMGLHYEQDKPLRTK